MKKFYLFLILSACLFAYNASAQDRNIYIWDVTASMIGKGTKKGKATPNVYKDVEEYLINDIHRISNNHTEIIVLPFQDKALLDFVIKVDNSTEESKKEIIAKIKQIGPECLKLNHKYTNISQPLKYAQDKYQNGDKTNKLVLLTDGDQNTNGGMPALEEATIEWSRKAKDGDFLIYVLTTENAARPTNKKLSNINIVTKDEFVEHIETLILKPTSSVHFNIRDDKTFDISFTLDSDSSLPTGAKIRVNSLSGAPIVIDEIVELKGGKVHITPRFNLDELKEQLSTEHKMRLNINVENNLELANQNKQLCFAPDYTELIIINKREKVLSISLVE